jgi:uncharacterized Zn-binding protein involved in type VI secretion
MGQPAARKGDTVKGLDKHVVIVPGPPPFPMVVQLPFEGPIVSDTVASVLIEGAPAATVGSIARNVPPHVPPPGTSFRKPPLGPPSNQGSVSRGSTTVTIGGRPAARVGDRVRTCNDPFDAETSVIVSGSGTATIG